MQNANFSKYPNGKCTASYKSEALEGNDTCFSDDTFTDTNTYYEYYNTDGKKVPEVEFYSDESGSTRLPYYEYENLSLRRHSRNSEGSFDYRNKKCNPVIKQKNVRRVYPNQDDRFFPDNTRY